MINIYEGGITPGIDTPLIKPVVREVPLEMILAFPPGGIEIDRGYVDDVDSQIQEDQSSYRLGNTAASTWEAIVKIPGNYTKVAQHSIEASWIAQQFGKMYGLSKEQNSVLAIAMLNHDVGQMDIASLINKEKEFTKDELILSARHTEYGHRFLSDMNFPKTVRNVALEHHSSYKELSGYPDEERLFITMGTLADKYAAARDVNRRYKPVQANWKAFYNIVSDKEEICEPKLFGLFEQFCKYIEELESKYGNVTIFEIAQLKE
ncbi:MAG TPA: HD domain-containing phosphohydrolase [Candidatus Saccharimonadales bacterium]|nr:HD domain-containing phosphohydrolase [Candidatus Saccharimonadales bacterium]